MLCLSKNVVRFAQNVVHSYIPKKRWFIVSISIEQNSHKAVTPIYILKDTCW